MLVDINLLGEKERDRPVYVVAAISLIFLGLVAGLVFYFLGNSYDSKQQVLAAESAEIISQQAVIQEQMLTSEALNDTQKLQKTVDWAETYKYETLPLIRELTSLLPERGFFMNFSFTSPSEALIDVQFDTSREAAFYLTQLKSSEMITAVSLATLTYQPLADDEEEESDEETSSTQSEAEPEALVMPRYVASYTISFIDTRMPADGTATPADPNAPPVEGETPVNPAVEPSTDPATPPDPQAPADDAQGDDAND